MPSIIPEPQNVDRAQEPVVPLPTGEAFVTSLQEEAMRGPLFGTLRAMQMGGLSQTGRYMTANVAKEEAKRRGFDLDIPINGLSEGQLEAMISNAQDAADAEEKLSRAGSVATFAGSVAGQFADPGGAMLNLLPIVGSERQAMILAQATRRAGAFGRAGARAGIGAVEGAVGGALMTPFGALDARLEGGDYTLGDAAVEIAMGAVAGGILQAGAGAAGEAVAPLADRSSSKWIREKFGTESMEWKRVIEAEDKLKAEMEPEIREAVAERAGVEAEVPRADADRAEPMAAPDRVAPEPPPSKLAEVIGERRFIEEARTGSDPLTVEIHEAIRANEAEISKAPEQFRDILEAADALATDRASSLTTDEALAYGTGRNLTPPQKGAAIALDAMRGEPERMARFVRTYGEKIAEGKVPEDALSDAMGAVVNLQGPTEKYRVASQQTRENAAAVAEYQARNGATIDAESVVDADPAIGEKPPTATVEQVRRATNPAERWDAKTGREAVAEAEAVPMIESLDDAAEQLANDAEMEYEALTRQTEILFSKDQKKFSPNIEVDPNGLVFREEMQNRTSDVEEMFPPGEGYTPIVLIDTGASLEILDGHNRAAVAKERGDLILASVITEEEYGALSDSGLDDMEIAYAAHIAAGEHDAADSIDRQFVGAKVSDKGEDGAYDLREMRKITDRFAKGAGGAETTTAEARAQLVERFGEDLVALGESFGFEIVPTWRDLPTDRATPDAVAVTKGKKVYIAAASLPEKGGAGIYLHEMGVHVGMGGMLGEEGFADLLAKSEALFDRDPTLRRVVETLTPTDTPTRYLAEERLAYLVQEMEGIHSGRDWPEGLEWARIDKAETRTAIVELVRDLVAKVKAWAYAKAPGLRSVMELNERDFHALAVRALEYGFNAERMEFFSKKAKEAEDEIAAAKEASKRARSDYKKAYDAIAALPDASDDDLAKAAMGAANLSPEEAAGLVKRFRDAGGDVAAALKGVTTDAEIQRLRAVQNAIKLHQGLQYLSGFRDDPIEGLLAMDGGTFWNVKGARRSVDTQQNQWSKLLRNGPEHELRAAGIYDKVRDVEFNRPLALALYDLQMGADMTGPGKAYGSDHVAAAQIMQKYQRIALSAQRRYGVESGELKGRILDQQHDTYALRNFANGHRTGPVRSALRDALPGKSLKIGDPAHKKAWVDFILPLLDSKTYDGRDVTREYLEASFDLLAGYKVKGRDAELLSGQYRELPGEAFRISNRSRKLKFKDAESWIAYQERCGNPNFVESFFGEMMSASKSLGILDIYGPGAEYTRAKIHAAVGQRLTGVQASQFNASRGKLERQWAVTSGLADIPANEVAASAWANYRSLKILNIMCGAVLSQLPDFRNFGRMRALRFNRNAFGIWPEMGRQVGDFFRAAKNRPETKAILSAFQADLDATTAGLLRRFQTGDSRGFMSEAVSKMYLWQGATWLNKNNKNGAILGFSNFMAENAGATWKDLPPTFREYLEQFGTTEAEWDLIRRGEQIAEDGRGYLTPEGLARVSDEDLLASLEAQGYVWNRNRDGTTTTDQAWIDRRRKAAAEQLRLDLQNRMIAIAHDFAESGAMEPDSRVRVMTTGGQQPGTFMGELARNFFFIKSFALSQMKQDWQIETRGYSRDPRAAVRQFEKSQFLATANSMVALTMLGFLSYMLKGWSKGVQRKGLVDQGDDEDKVLPFDVPLIDDRTLIASALQGGALGLYGDFMFKEQNRFGGGLLETASGPIIADLERLYKIYQGARGKGALEDPGKLGNDAVGFLKGMVPFSNMWYTRMVMDNLLWFKLQEAINPEALGRLEKMAEQRQDRYIFAKPSTASWW